MAESVMKKRHTGLDMLRVIAMLMIVVLHYLGKGHLLPYLSESENWNAVSIVAWFIEALCVVAVNLYMLLSGYFLATSSAKLSRLLGLYIQLWFYSVGIGMAAWACGLVPAEDVNIYNFLTLIFPVSMAHYWFLTAYVFFYLLLPFLGIAVRKMKQSQHLACIILLLFFITIPKSLFPVVLENDAKGYDFLWYIILFLIAAYLRKYNSKLLNKKYLIPMYVIGTLGSFGGVLIIGKICEMTGRLERVLSVTMHYNDIFPLMASVGLFGLFLKVDIKGGFAKVIGFITPYTLGVYLLHENIGVRYLWQNWLGADKINSVLSLVLHVIFAAVIVFAVGILFEFIRSKLFLLLDKGLSYIPPYKKLKELIARVDMILAPKDEMNE